MARLCHVSQKMYTCNACEYAFGKDYSEQEDTEDDSSHYKSHIESRPHPPWYSGLVLTGCKDLHISHPEEIAAKALEVGVGLSWLLFVRIRCAGMALNPTE